MAYILPGLFDNMFKFFYLFICIKLRDIKSAGSTTSSPSAWEWLLRLVSHSIWERLLRLALISSSLATVTTDSLSQARLTQGEHEQKQMVGRKIYFSLIGSLEKSVIWGRMAAQQQCRTLGYFTFSSSQPCSTVSNVEHHLMNK